MTGNASAILISAMATLDDGEVYKVMFAMGFTIKATQLISMITSIVSPQRLATLSSLIRLT
ncbi:MAG: hypothetical protein QMC38_15570 [Sinobacterium sp.]